MNEEDKLVTMSMAVAKWLAQGRSQVELTLLQGFFISIATNIDIIRRSRECCIILEKERKKKSGGGKKRGRRPREPIDEDEVDLDVLELLDED